jgi:hypothetical protein
MASVNLDTAYTYVRLLIGFILVTTILQLYRGAVSFIGGENHRTVVCH